MAENCDLLGYYIVSSGNFLPMFQDNSQVPSSGVDGLSWNVGKKIATTWWVITQKNAVLIYCVAEVWYHIDKADQEHFN
jgi:hypothetical protein